MSSPAHPLLKQLTNLFFQFFQPKKASAALCPRGDRQDCMSCPKMEFNGEICLHFPGGLESLDKPLVWVFPKVLVCLDCGSAQFAVAETQLKLIQENLVNGMKAAS